jgi:uncharacterized protein YyaL (SSP411 family)
MPNGLAHATSPYLLQHSENPVDWRPWGEEAFALARRLDRPLLLSIGYASCHWCHVMAHESFEDERLAEFLNEHFVCVKVDREERPDVDALYMSAVQAMTGSGGWPLTVILTPGGAPFFGGTYFPPQPRWGRPSFRQVLEGVSRAWSERRDEVEEAARSMHEQLRVLEAPFAGAAAAPAAVRAPGPAGEVGAGEVGAGEAAAREAAAGGRALAALAATFDAERGGFGGAPKFPPHGALRFLLDRPEDSALAMATATLDAMADGGIHDQLGGGFARYSVDALWDVPHFEKMLYDNAQLLQLYAEGYRRSGRARYAVVAEGIVGWMARELLTPEGALCSSLDADSEGEEGRFYSWTEDEIDAVPGIDAAFVKRHFGVRTPGPFEGRNVLRVTEPLPATAAAFGLEPEEAAARLGHARRALAAARERRPRPALDDKVLASWNGLALTGLADAARLLGSERSLTLAHGLVRFVRAELLQDGRLLHAWRGGSAHIEGLLEDYAYLGLGLLALHRLTLEAPLLELALDLAEVVRRDFEAEDGGFYSTSRRAERLLVRPRSLADAAVPSDNAAAAELLARLARVTGDGASAEAAARAVGPLEDVMERHPQAFATALAVRRILTEPPLEVVLVGDPRGADTAALAAAWRRRADPTVAALLVSGPDDALARRCPLAQGRERLEGRASAYVCQGGVCRLPVVEVAAFERELDAIGLAPLSIPPHSG